MARSMTGFSKTEASENGTTVTIELKSLNGKNLDINCKFPRNLFQYEIEMREMLKSFIARGTVSLYINIFKDANQQLFVFNEDAAVKCFDMLTNLKKTLKIRDAIKMEHVLGLSHTFAQPVPDDNTEFEWQLTKKTLRNAITSLNRMRTNEGKLLAKDMLDRIKKISDTVEKIETLGIQRIPDEREKLRQKVAQLFESDEIDEHRIQTELVLIADKLDISEECVRLRSHIKFFIEILKENNPIGRKINFLLQEMNREINTIGSKSCSTEIAHFVVFVKEELEKIKEQNLNIE